MCPNVIESHRYRVVFFLLSEMHVELLRHTCVLFISLSYSKTFLLAFQYSPLPAAVHGRTQVFDSTFAITLTKLLYAP